MQRTRRQFIPKYVVNLLMPLNRPQPVKFRGHDDCFEVVSRPRKVPRFRLGLGETFFYSADNLFR